MNDYKKRSGIFTHNYLLLYANLSNNTHFLDIKEYEKLLSFRF